MRSVIGAIYGGLLALIAIFVIDILVSGATIGPDGVGASWVDPFRKLLLIGGLTAGIAAGAWRGRHRDKVARTRRRDDDHRDHDD